MKPENTPAAGAGYWVALSAASVFGADCGDCVSRVLGLGHLRGLPVLAALFASTLLAERRARRPTVAFYWVAIVLLRTGATNVGDLLTHDLRLGYLLVAAALAVALAVCVRVALRRERAARALPSVDGLYWLAMAVAGTFGTVAGDACSRAAGHDPGLATAWLLPVVLAAAAWRWAQGGLVRYWVLVAAIRTIGTTFGDWSADATTLPFGTAASGIALLVLIRAAVVRSTARASAA